MTFAIDTGFGEIRSLSGVADDTQDIRFRTHQQATRAYNRIRENIESHEDQFDLDAYWQRETLILDALHLYDPRVSEDLRDIYETHRATLVHGGVNRIAQSDPRRTDSGTAQAPINGQDGKAKDWFDEL
jgi:hypothetical protein